MQLAIVNTVLKRFGLKLLPWLILAVTLGVTCFAWDHERKNNQKALRTQFDFVLRETVSRVEQRVHGYEQMLRGVQSLFATTPLSNRNAMRDYVDSLQLNANFSGVQVIGVVEWVPAFRQAAHVAGLRTNGFATYAIQPEGEREAYAPIVQREPYVGRNRAPLGGDVWLDPMRRIALEKARDSGLPAISGKVRLMVDTEADATPGFIMYLPIYAQGQPRESVDQRRAHLIGWVYAAFHMSDFMASLYGSQSPGLALEIFDDVDTRDNALLYRATGAALPTTRTEKAALSADEYMVVAGHTWTLSLSTQASFEDQYGRGNETLILAAGGVLSMLLALLAWLLINGREQALHLARGMTEELRHMAQHDPLTKLPNRALFDDRLQQELARAKRLQGRLAMVFIDLDYFKLINDQHGHEVGDHVLREVARRLSNSVRAVDTVGRIGGDEFVVLMAALSADDSVLALAEKLRESMRPSIVTKGLELIVSCSIGIAVYPEDGTDAITLTKAADEAMYRAKQAGRDCVRLTDTKPHTLSA